MITNDKWEGIRKEIVVVRVKVLLRQWCQYD